MKKNVLVLRGEQSIAVEIKGDKLYGHWEQVDWSRLGRFPTLVYEVLRGENIQCEEPRQLFLNAGNCVIPAFEIAVVDEDLARATEIVGALVNTVVQKADEDQIDLFQRATGASVETLQDNPWIERFLRKNGGKAVAVRSCLELPGGVPIPIGGEWQQSLSTQQDVEMPRIVEFVGTCETVSRYNRMILMIGHGAGVKGSGEAARCEADIDVETQFREMRSCLGDDRQYVFELLQLVDADGRRRFRLKGFRECAGTFSLKG